MRALTLLCFVVALATSMPSIAARIEPAGDRPSSELPTGTGPWVVRAYYSSERSLELLLQRAAPWRVDRNAEAIEAMRKSPGYEALKAEAERQWNAGNRGEHGKWIERRR